MDAPTLFDAPSRPAGSSMAADFSEPRGHRATDPTTSVMAARADRGTVRGALLTAYLTHPDGLTNDEAIDHVRRILGEPDKYGPTITSARAALTTKGILVEHPALLRKSKRGRDAHVYVVAQGLRRTETTEPL